MTRRNSVIIVTAAALIFAGIATWAIYDYLQKPGVIPTVEMQNIVVAVAEIPIGSTIDAAQVKTSNWPKASVPPGALLVSEQAVGRVVLERVLPGEPILEARLIPKDGVPGILTYKIPKGNRAMTVAVDQVAGVAGFITPGNKVDVVLTTTPPGAQQSISKIIPNLQNLLILAIGQIIEQQKDGKPVIVPTVTMDVTPEQAEQLAVASTQGKLQLILRRAGDVEFTRTAGATVTRVMAGIQPSEAAVGKKMAVQEATKQEKPAPTPHTVEVFKGTTKTIEQFKTETVK